MQRMKLPGFTAENSIRNHDGPHRLATTFDSEKNSVQPAARKICDVLAEAVWGAYNEKAYNRAEFWEGVMEKAGCFN